jgi:anti-sigma factor RsiW
MTKTFTQNDLIRYIYNETSQEESLEIQKALLFDDALHEEHKQLRATVNLLDELLEPGASSSVATSRSKV